MGECGPPSRLGKLDEARVRIARVFAMTALTVLLFDLLVLLPWTWFRAWQLGQWPFGYTGLDGPWDHNAELSVFVEWMFALPLLAAVVAVPGLVLHPTSKKGALVVACGVAVVVLVATHFWLID